MFLFCSYCFQIVYLCSPMCVLIEYIHSAINACIEGVLIYLVIELSLVSRFSRSQILEPGYLYQDCITLDSRISRSQVPEARYLNSNCIILDSRIFHSQVIEPRYLDPDCITLDSRISRSQVPAHTLKVS